MNWIATYYDEDNNILFSVEIKDRTEKEAFNEAETYIDETVYDWTLMPI